MALIRGVATALIVIMLGSCATVPKYCDSLPRFMAEESASIQEQRLYCAYREQSEQRLAAFFEGWSLESQSISNDELEGLPEPVRYAYDLFEDFYRPKELNRVGDAEWGSSQFLHAKYFLVSPELVVTVKVTLPESSFGYDDVPTIAQWDLDDFRPKATSDIPLCYLNNRYRNLIRRYLGDKELQAGHRGIMSTSVARGESLLRQQFINKKVQIYHGHWGGWNLATDPSVTQVVFDEKLEYAKLYFSLVYQGGEALYRRDGNIWRLVKSELTWIT